MAKQTRKFLKENEGADAAKKAEQVMDQKAHNSEIVDIVNKIMDGDPTYNVGDPQPDNEGIPKDVKLKEQKINESDDPIFGLDDDTEGLPEVEPDEETPYEDGMSDEMDSLEDNTADETHEDAAADDAVDHVEPDGDETLTGKEPTEEKKEDEVVDEELDVKFDAEKNTITIKDKEQEDLVVQTDFKVKNDEEEDKEKGKEGEDAPKEGDLDAEMNADALEAEAEEGAIREQLDQLFAKNKLSDEFRTSALMVFEMMANAKAKRISTKKTKQVIKALDKFMNEKVEQFYKENRAKIDTAIREARKVEAYKKMRSLTESIFSDDVSGVIKSEKLIEENRKLRAALEAKTKENAGLKDKMEQIRYRLHFDKLTEGVAKEVKESVKVLIEGMDFPSLEDFTKRVNAALSGAKIVESKRLEVEAAKKRIDEAKKPKAPEKKEERKPVRRSDSRIDEAKVVEALKKRVNGVDELQDGDVVDVSEYERFLPK